MNIATNGKVPVKQRETALESFSDVRMAKHIVRTATKCLCGKCKTCQNRRYSAEWRKRHPGPAKLARVRHTSATNGVVGATKRVASGSIASWRTITEKTTERAVAASRKANHQPERFAEWSKRRLAELRCKWQGIAVR